MICYLTRGKLYYVNANGKEEEIVSPFAEEAYDRAVRGHQRNAWKGGSDENNFNSGMVWGGQVGGGSGPSREEIRFNGVTRGGETALRYFITTSAAGGYFTYDLTAKEETRHFHKENFFARQPALHPVSEKLACSIFTGDSSNISVTRSDGRGLEEVTEGDSMDQYPTWKPDGEALAYQSMGIGRNAQGIAVGYGPSSIELIDFERRSSDTLLEESGFDFLCPRFDGQGNLYYIKRPYQSSSYQTPGYWGAFKDFVMFPYRLCVAFISFLNAFSLFFTKKPLTTAGGPAKKFDNPTHLHVQGRMLAVENLNSDPKSPGALSIKVPADWELIRQDPQGEKTVLASNVAFYDVNAAGCVAYSNGSTLYVLEEGQKTKTIVSNKLIEEIAVL